MSKQYGLIIPNKNKLTPANEIKKPSIFNDDSDSEEEVEKPTGFASKLKHQDKIAREKAVEEDPTVFQYDEVYDSIEQKRKDAKLSRKDLDKKPKYISRLLAAAEKRKMDNERRIERQVQKEREAEGDEFKDKESFVTSAYRQKLEEFKKLEEEEKREEYLEAIGDVTRQSNLDGFYRHLYDQKINYDDNSKEKEEKPSKSEDKSPRNEDKSPKNEDKSPKNEDKSPKNEDKSSQSEDDEEIKETATVRKKRTTEKRKYRKRESSESEDKEENAEETDKKLEHLPSNLDADSDFSIDSDSDDDGEESPSKKVKKDVEETLKKVEETKENVEEKKEDVVVKEEQEDGKEKVEEKVEEQPKKPKIDIWKKRTVGSVFDEALQRYFERKALRESNGL